MIETYEKIIISGKAFYCNPKEMSPFATEDKPEYNVTIGHLSESTVKMLAEKGRAARKEFDPSKSKHEIENFIVASSKYPIKLVDANKEPIPDGVLVGNGSDINVLVEVRPIAKEYQKANKVKYIAKAVQVVNFVEVPKDGDWEPQKSADLEDLPSVEGGFSAKDVEVPSAGSEAPPFEEDALDDEITL